MRAIRMISTEIYEPCGTEIYLEEMDHQGYHLDAAGKFLFYFDRTEPRDMRYRVEYWKGELPDDLVALYRDCGWEYVAETQRNIHIFRAPADIDIPELHTDGEIEAQRYQFKKRRMIGLGIWTAAYMALILGFNAALGIQTLFTPGYAWRQCTFLTLFLALGMYQIVQAVRAYRHWKNLRTGRQEVRGNSKRYRRGVWLSYICVVLYVSILGVLIGDVLDSTHRHIANFVPLSQMSEQLDTQVLPYFTLEDLGRPDSKTWEQRSGVYLHQPLTRMQYAWWSQTDDENWRDGTYLELTYYDVRIPLTDRLLVESIHVEEAQRVQTGAFDTLYRYQDGVALYLTARLGRVVVDMDYTGDDPDRAEVLFYETFGR